MMIQICIHVTQNKRYLANIVFVKKNYLLSFNIFSLQKIF